MDTMTIHKLNSQGESVLSYNGVVAERFADGVRVEATWERAAMDLGYVRFETGDRFIEWFFSDRWYNIFEIASPDGTLKGWYCNVAAPAVIEADDLFCRDLILDLWVTPEGATSVLDEDDFAAEQSLDAATRAQALAGLAELQRLVAERQGPFSRLRGR